MQLRGVGRGGLRGVGRVWGPGGGNRGVEAPSLRTSGLRSDIQVENRTSFSLRNIPH